MNGDLKKMIRDAGLTQWQVAEHLGIAESTFIRWLRYELTGKRYQEIKNAIEVLACKKAEEGE